MDRQKAETIAQWWCDRMDDKHKHDNGYAETEVKIKEFQQFGLIQGDQGIPDHKKDAFKRWLTIILMGDKSNLESICVDYDPDAILEEALELADINFNPFPIKTILWIETMTCRIGYSGDRIPVEVS